MLGYPINVSIPNGMEFYPNPGGGGHPGGGRFQFPTGWNSTSFYFYTSKNSDGFNSQRDGILLKEGGSLDPKFRVSIPNGMEFYKTLIEKSLGYQRFQFPTGWNSTEGEYSVYYAMACFNSQRDGILRIQGFQTERLLTFQFPTGWNSTPSVSISCLDYEEFQFPTGWNSTNVESIADLLSRGRFNSQRDGILPS